MSIRDIITKPMTEDGIVTVDPMDEQVHIHKYQSVRVLIDF